MNPDINSAVLKPVHSESEIAAVAGLASQIWNEHFTPILGQAQVGYMLENFQSADAIRKAVNRDGYRYYFIMTPENKTAGYCAVQPRIDALYLSKLYIAKPFRGRKLAVAVIDALCTTAAREHLPTIRLNCNRFNKNTLAIYDRLGFRIIKEEKESIGNGFYTDDYVLEKTLTVAKIVSKPNGTELPNRSSN